MFQFERLLLRLNPETVFPRAGPPLGAREMSIPQLRARAAELEREGIYPHSELFEIQKKFSIPFACLVFGLIGLALGASNRRDGKLASFVVGLAVIFVYYVLLWLGQSLAARARGAAVAGGLAAEHRARRPSAVCSSCGATGRFDRVLRMPSLPRVGPATIPPLSLPMLGILDRYVATTVRARGCAGSGRNGRHLLHLHVPGLVGQGVPRPGDVGDALAATSGT